MVSCDVTDRAALAVLLSTVPAEHPLTAVVHTAGVVDDGLLTASTPDRIGRVLAPKVDAAWHLHELTHDLAAFVLFSSYASTVGTAGQAPYAAANGFLDALAQVRHAAGRPATAVAWGWWEQVSDLTASLGAVDRARLARSGVAALPTAAALRLLDEALSTSDPALVAVRLEPAALRTRAAAGELPALLRELAPAEPARTGTGPASDGPAGSFADRLARLDPDDRAAEVVRLVRSATAAVLGFPAATPVDPDRAFTDLGIDSLTAVELRNSLQRSTAVPLAASLVFDHPTPRSVAGHLTGRLAPAEKDPLAALLGYVDRLGAELGALPADSAAPVVDRLRALLSGLSTTDDEPPADPLAEASDDDLFDLVDNLGPS